MSKTQKVPKFLELIAYLDIVNGFEQKAQQSENKG